MTLMTLEVEKKNHPTIRILAPGIAERIAAGEVIERPASVVKELVENSLDAGATEISIQLEDGGKKLIEIRDNGHGMSGPDMELCIERHATSKLNALEDLERISTLGFRGEALPSIAAVSEMSIISRAVDADSAYEMTVGDLLGRLQGGEKPKAQKTTFGHFNHSPHGTLFRIVGLFSQVPARLKFMKSQAAEVSHVREWIERLAMAHPHVGFKVTSDARVLLNLRPQDEKSRIQTILADDQDYPIVSAFHEQDGMRDNGLQIRVHWLQGLSSNNSRKLIQSVNSRAVRDKVLQQAVLAPFRQALMPGQFPAVAVMIQINPGAVDVNVHPTKTEIRFLDSRKIFHSIETLVKSMIAQKGAPAVVAASLLGETQPPHLSSPPYGELRAPLWKSHAPLWKASEDIKDLSFTQTPQTQISAQSLSPGLSQPSPSPSPSPSTQPLPETENLASTPISDRPFSTPSHSFTPQPLFEMDFTRHLGTLFQSYLVYEKPNELMLIDQHAAHERIRYEKLRVKILKPTPTPTLSQSQDYPAQVTQEHSPTPKLSAQSLLIPEVIKFTPESRAQVETSLNHLSRFSFEGEIFGEDTVVFRATPMEWGTHALKPRLKNLMDRLLSFSSSSSSSLGSLDSVGEIWDETLFEALASEACHSAVRSGDLLEPEEIQDLVSQLFACEHPWNCPHGRPTVVKIARGKIEEWFQRRQ